MRIFQENLDEKSLLSHLQSGDWDKAIEVIDWYYSHYNDHGFDDPNGITKAENIVPFDKLIIPFAEPVKIRQSSKSNRSILYIIAAFFAFFGFLSYNVGNLFPMIIPSILLPVAVVLIYNLIVKYSQITLSKEHIEFRKSTKPPIRWENILVIYHYHRGTGGIKISPGHTSADFIEIYKKDNLISESYNIDYLEYDPKDIVYLINEYRMKNEI